MCIELAEVDLESGINKREATACDNYPEEWPKVFIFHGARGDTNVVQVMRENNAALIRIDRGFEMLVLCWLLPRQENRFVGGPKMKTTFSIKALGPLIRFVHQQAN